MNKWKNEGVTESMNKGITELMRKWMNWNEWQKQTIKSRIYEKKDHVKSSSQKEPTGSFSDWMNLHAHKLGCFDERKKTQ